MFVYIKCICLKRFKPETYFKKKKKKKKKLFTPWGLKTADILTLQHFVHGFSISLKHMDFDNLFFNNFILQMLFHLYLRTHMYNNFPLYFYSLHQTGKRMIYIKLEKRLLCGINKIRFSLYKYKYMKNIYDQDFFIIHFQVSQWPKEYIVQNIFTCPAQKQ